jgi:hypothetical protein
MNQDHFIENFLPQKLLLYHHPPYLRSQIITNAVDWLALLMWAAGIPTLPPTKETKPVDKTETILKVKRTAVLFGSKWDNKQLRTDAMHSILVFHGLLPADGSITKITDENNLRKLATAVFFNNAPNGPGLYSWYSKNREKINKPEEIPLGVFIANDLGFVDDALMKTNTGGIDLNPAQMSMQIKNDGEDFKFNINGTVIDAAQVIGAAFTIQTITPVTNLSQILGLNQDPAYKSNSVV